MKNIFQVLIAFHQFTMPVDQVDKFPSTVCFSILLVCKDLEFIVEYFELTSKMCRHTEEETVHDKLRSTNHKYLKNLDRQDYHILRTGNRVTQ